MGGYYDSRGLRELREAIGLTQREPAMLLGVNRVTVARWEGGGVVGATVVGWLSALETAWRAVSLHAEGSPQGFEFLQGLTRARVPWAWARVLALAHPEAWDEVADLRKMADDG